MRWMAALVLVSTFAVAGEKPILELNVGAVGTVYVTKQEGDALTLNVVFPASVVENPNGAGSRAARVRRKTARTCAVGS